MGDELTFGTIRKYLEEMKATQLRMAAGMVTLGNRVGALEQTAGQMDAAMRSSADLVQHSDRLLKDNEQLQQELVSLRRDLEFFRGTSSASPTVPLTSTAEIQRTPRKVLRQAREHIDIAPELAGDLMDDQSPKRVD